MDNNLPLVTVNILSYNRKDELRNTLQKVFQQDYKKIEVIVVDNASTDGSSEMIEKEFPDACLIKLENNIGVAGWNEGFRAANGDYVLVLDDDAYPAQDAINQALVEFELDKSIGCIASNLFDLTTQKFEVSNWLPDKRITRDKCYWPIFIGCAVFFNNKKLNLKNIIPDNYFLYQHELPVASEIILSGYKILYSNNVVGYHRFKNKNIYSSFSDQQCLKNNLLFINTYFPYHFSILYSIQAIVYYFTRSIKGKWFIVYLNIIFKNKYLVKKRRVPFTYFWSLRKLHIFNFSILSKFKLR